MPVTIKDIARVAGVSHTTVSRALHNHPALSPGTVQRVKAIAEELGYAPSAVARGLKNRRSQALGAVLNYLDDPFFSRVLDGIEDVLQPHGYSLFVAASRQDVQCERTIMRAMLERRVDAVILCAPPLLPGVNQRFPEYAMPLVIVNNQNLEDYPYSICHDDYYGATSVAQHLVSLGHRRIAYLGNATAGRTNHDRLNGFQNVVSLAALPIPPEYVHHEGGGHPEDGYRAVGHFLQLPEPPTAIMCFNDMMALGLLRGLHEAGWIVPRDCSIAGFDDVAIAAYTQPPLTTFDQPKYRLGAEAVRLALCLLQHPHEQPAPAPQAITLRGQLLIRGSTAPLRS